MRGSNRSYVFFVRLASAGRIFILGDKNMGFAENFKNARKAANLTQEQVAEALGLDRSAVAHYEKGDSTPHFKNLPKICEILDIKLEDLI